MRRVEIVLAEVRDRRAQRRIAPRAAEARVYGQRVARLGHGQGVHRAVERFALIAAGQRRAGTQKALEQRVAFAAAQGRGHQQIPAADEGPRVERIAQDALFGAQRHLTARADIDQQRARPVVRRAEEAGLIVALIVGIIIGNLFPSVVEYLHEACRPELFVKIAIVILGCELGVKAASAAGFAGVVIFRGLCAIVEAYLLYWAFVYYVARKFFKFNKEWAAPLASGISICGVSAAIATGGAIRARPIVPIMVSSLVVVFTCIEMLLLPFVASYFLGNEPMVAGGWMGLAVKSDGGAIASGAITESLILTKAAGNGTNWEPGWIQMVTTTVKIFIDMFIGVWAFVLAYIWTKHFDPEAKKGRAMSWGDVWDRFPRFVLGYVITFLIMLGICIVSPDLHKTAAQISGPINGLRTLFFLLTFFSIGMISNFRKLLEEGIGRLAIVYIVCLFGFIIWIGLFISWLFFHGMTPPLAQ